METQRFTVSVGAEMARIGATVQLTAPKRVRELMEPLVLIVAVAVGRVVQVPPVTVTVGTDVYPAHPSVIFANVPAIFDSAVAVFGQILNPSLQLY